MPKQNSGRLAAKANQLYWQTSRPAGRLADELGISRSKFYALIEPLRLDIRCVTCSAPLSFSSRSDREAGRGRCANCGATAEVATPALDVEVAEPEVRTAEPAQPAADPGAGNHYGRPGERELWLAAAAGLAVGLLVTAWWRRR